MERTYRINNNGAGAVTEHSGSNTPDPGTSFRMIGAVFIIIAVAIGGYIWYRNSQKRQQPIIFSTKLMLSALWETYKKEYWREETGRTIDTQRNNVTTSEGQSYTMLRAVWQDDKPVFDKTWEWTKENIKRPDADIFSWLYGRRLDGSYGILEDQGGINTATDADTDIAFALILASARWENTAYLEEAKKIIRDIWENEVVHIDGIPYVAANNLEKGSSGDVIINPSYLAPYAYRVFAKLDPEHDWGAAIDSSYELLERASVSAIDKAASSGLPPDWMAIDRSTREIKKAEHDNYSTNYSYDAMRTPFRLALDWQWNNEPRAKEVLSRYYFLGQEWQANKKLFATYSHDGTVISDIESPAIYGGSFGYFLVARPELAEEVYKTKLESLYSPDIQSWKKPMNYYDDNWSWFGLALYNKTLTNLVPVTDNGNKTVHASANEN